MIYLDSKNSILKCAMSFFVIIINVIRKPQLLHQPRFFAEEGANFFAYAYNHSFLDNMLNPQFGYYTLYNMLATSFAAKFNLLVAPLVTTWLALVVQVCVSIMVIWSNIPILDSNAKKFVFAVSIPLLCPSQIWLTTIGIQYWLCVAVMLILLEGDGKTFKKYHMFKSFMLILSGLTGVLSCLMMPVFLVKSVVTKSKQFILYTWILVICSCVQLFVFVRAYLGHDAGLTGRFSTSDSAFSIASITMVKFFSDFILYNQIEKVPFFNSVFRYTVNIFNGPDLIYIITGMVMLIFFILLIVKTINNFDMMCVATISIIIYIVSIVFSLGVKGGPRYIFAPSIMVMLLIIVSCDLEMFTKVDRVFIRFIIASILVTHVLNFVPSMDRTYNSNWPLWSKEVRNWQLDSTYPIKIWPPPWQMALHRRR